MRLLEVRLPGQSRPRQLATLNPAQQFQTQKFVEVLEIHCIPACGAIINLQESI
jgi:hypothetical protein